MSEEIKPTKALDELVKEVRELPQEPLVTPLQPMADPHPSRAYLHAPEHELVGHPLRSVRRVRQGVGQDRLLHLRGDPVRVRAPSPRHAVQEPLGPVHLKVPSDLVELLPAVARDPARLRDVAQLLGEF